MTTMSRRREFTRNQRFEIIKRATTEDNRILCEGCGFNVTFKRWEIDHTIPEELVVDKSKPLTIEDGKLLGVDCCHRGGRNKTAKDAGDIARAKRREAKHLGIRKRSTFPCSRDSKLKKKINGEVVFR